ncbi:cellulase family glycosylhydrolase [Priestia megaterium]|uniref:cellulase family glycosylhydrolase n=1 Tax=Priestia megaterium TaxID=1404 RepID=UPI0039F69DB9
MENDRSICLNNLKFLSVICIIVFIILSLTQETTNTRLKLSETLGVNIHDSWNATSPTLIKKYGANIVRDGITWGVVEKTPGVYDFTNNGRINYDTLVEKLKNNNLQPLLILLYTNKLYGENRALDNEKIKQAYVRYVSVTTSRYKNNGIIWEIYNEPNGGFWSPQTNSAANYTDVVKRVYPVIKNNDPSGLVVAPALSRLDEPSLRWLEETFKLGLLDYVDAISVHPYRRTNPETVIADYAKLRTLIAKYTDKEIPIMADEWGYSNVPNWNGFGGTSTASSELQQAQFITRMILINHAEGIENTLVYDWKDDGQDPGNIEHHFGLMKFDQKTPKKSGTAYKTLVDTLGNYRYVERVDNGNADDYVFKYIDDNSKIAYAFWTSGSDHRFTLNGRIKGEVTSMFGHKAKVDGRDITFYISESPSYLIID